LILELPPPGAAKSPKKIKKGGKILWSYEAIGEAFPAKYL
jgi:hypothetical protein